MVTFSRVFLVNLQLLQPTVCTAWKSASQNRLRHFRMGSPPLATPRTRNREVTDCSWVRSPYNLGLKPGGNKVLGRPPPRFFIDSLPTTPIRLTTELDGLLLDMHNGGQDRQSVI
jgi:hypothetical protein